MYNLSRFGRLISPLKEKTQLAWLRLSGASVDHPLASILASAGMFTLMMIYTRQRVSFPFHYDSLYYWELGSSFYANDQFSFVNFSDGLRGYFFPFLLSLIQHQEVLTGVDLKVLFAILSALFFTVFSMHLVPWFFSEGFGWRSAFVATLWIMISFTLSAATVEQLIEWDPG